MSIKVKIKNFLVPHILKIPSRFHGTRIRRIKQYQQLESSLLNVGKGTYGTNHIILHNWNLDSRAYIGKYCSIADNVHLFLGGNHDLNRITTYPFALSQGIDGPQLKIGGPTFSNGDIMIGNDVWIGSHVSIMSGIRIGNGAVIAAYSHVVKDVADYEVVGGNPAKHIKFRFSQQTIDFLLKLKWWNWSEQEIIANLDVLISPPEFPDQIRALFKRSAVGD